MTMDLEIIPCCSIGPFIIGRRINVILNIIRSAPEIWRNVQIVFDNDSPYQHDISILIDSILRLRFTSTTQLLRTVEIISFAHLSSSPFRLTYQNNSLDNSNMMKEADISPFFTMKHNNLNNNNNNTNNTANLSEDIPTFGSIFNSFGPTYSPTIHQKSQTMLLQYPGICFVFNYSQNHVNYPISSEALTSLGSSNSPKVRRLIVHDNSLNTQSDPQTLAAGNNSLQGNQMPITEASDAHFSDSSQIQIFLGQGLYFPNTKCWLNFDSEAQDVISLLGIAEDVYFKQDDKMKIHASTRTNSPHSPPTGAANFTGDYIYNYFSHGIDILFDGILHRVKKIICHSNLPGRHDFGIYSKCKAPILVSASQDEPSADEENVEPRHPKDSSAPSYLESFGLDFDHNENEALACAPGNYWSSPQIPSDNITNATQASTTSHLHIDINAPWSSIINDIVSSGYKVSRPMVHNLPRRDNPFGSSLFYASEGVIFEISTHAVAHVASLTLFNEIS